ncbi:hypothetical protein M5689_011718 [Euphorbia peplus]|nr:hypothetical protein M5689_011718 [Euphorbia peplus]
MFVFASSFVSIFTAKNYPSLSKLLNATSTVLALTAFFLAMSIIFTTHILWMIYICSDKKDPLFGRHVDIDSSGASVE